MQSRCRAKPAECSPRASVNSARHISWILPLKPVQLSGGLDYRVSGSLKLFVAAESKYDKVKAYWGTPLL